MSDTNSKSFISSIERATEVLMLFTRSPRPDLGVTEVSQELAMSKSVVHRVLATLASRNFLEVDPETRRYRLGHAVLALGTAYSDNLDLRVLAKPYLRSLADATRETAALSQRTGWERAYVEQAAPRRDVKMTVAIGHRFPLHMGAASKAFLAHLSAEEQDRYISQHLGEALSEDVLVDPTELRADLDVIRQRGYAVSDGQRASHVAVPVLDHRYSPLAVLSVCGPRERFEEFRERAVVSLSEAATSLSQRILGVDT